VAYCDSFAKDLNSELSNCNSTLVIASVVTLGHRRDDLCDAPCFSAFGQSYH